MEVEREDERLVSPPPSSSPFVTATVLLLAATIFISIASAARKERAPLDGKATEYLLQGDILYRLGGLSLKGSPYAQMADVWRSAAVEDYRFNPVQPA